MPSDTETSVLEAQRVDDTRVDTGTIRRIVCGGDSDTGVWYTTDGDAPLDALETTESEVPLEGALRGEVRSQRTPAVIVTGSERYWDGSDLVIRHRRREWFGVALLSGFTRPARFVGRGVHALWCVAVEASLRAYLAMVSVLGGFLVRVTSRLTWRAVPGAMKRAPGRVRAWLRARKWAVMRQRARYRAAGRRTEWGFTIRRQVAVRASKTSFAVAVMLGIWWTTTIIVLFIMGELTSGAPIYIGVGSTGMFLLAGFLFDVMAERADLHRYDMIIHKLPKHVREKKGAGFWAAQTMTDLDMPRPVHLRAHERAQPGAMPLRPAAPDRRVLAATRTDWTPEAGAWF